MRNRISNARRSGKRILSMAMSPLSRTWFMCFDDGTVDWQLPGDISTYIEEYCRPEYSLLSHHQLAYRFSRLKLLVDAFGGLSLKGSTSLRVLSPYSSESTDYTKVALLFQNGWKHPHKTVPSIKRIFKVELPDHIETPYSSYKSLLGRTRSSSGINERLVFHGTYRHCALGARDSATSPCSDAVCHLCGVLRTSFSVSRAGTTPDRNFLRFGHGIYTSNVSSKADDYANEPVSSSNRTLIVAKALFGRANTFYRTTQNLREPGVGFDSVFGEVGADLNYDEQVLYRDDAIRPAYVIVYDASYLGPGW